MAYDPRDTSNTETTTTTTDSTGSMSTETTKTVTIVAVVAVVVLALAGYFFYAKKTNQPVFSTTTVEQGYDATKSAVTPDKSASDAAK